MMWYGSSGYYKMGYKRFYLWGTVSLIGIFALIAPMITHYYSYEEQIVCGENCWVEFCMKNGNKDLYFYNKDSIPLTFEPEGKVKAVKFYQKDGRYKSGWRNINFIDPYFKGRKYVFKIPAYSARCYAMNISKEASDSLKWTFAGLDPWLIGIGQSGTNMSYEVDSCYNWTSLGDCFEVNFSRAFDQINWSDNATIHDGNYSWNFSEKGINAGNPWLFNFSNNGTVNLTVAIKLDGLNTSMWQLFYVDNATTHNLTSTSWIFFLNVSNGTTELVNFSLDVYDLNQTYVNWSLQSSRGGWAFNYTLNSTQEGVY